MNSRSLGRAENAIPAALVAGKFGIYGGLLGYAAFRGVSSVRTLSAGSLTLAGPADKYRDYAGAAGAILAALIAFVVIFELLEWLSRNLSPLTRRSLLRNLVLANIPAAFAIAGCVFSNQIDLVNVLYSSVAETTLLACLLGSIWRNGVLRSVDLDFTWVLPVLVFGLLAGALTVPSWVALAAATTHLQTGPLDIAKLSSILAKVSLAGSAILSVVVFLRADIRSIARSGCLLLGLAQIALILGGVRLVGPLIKVGGELQFFLQVSVLGGVCLGLFLIASLALTARTTLAAWRRPDPRPDLWSGKLLNPVAVAIAAIALKVSLDAPSFSVLDEYHTGEAAVPFWALAKFHLLPYVELAPARGWMNLIYGAFGELMFKPSWVNYGFMGPYLALSAYLFLFVGLRGLTGGWFAFFLVCLAPPPNSLSEIDLVMTGLFALICVTSLKCRPATWLIVWVVLGTAAVLFAPGQGGLLVAATGLLGLARFAEAVQGDRKLLLRNLLGLAGIAAVLGLLTPLGPMIFGAVRYGLEQSSANTEMNAIAWRPSPGMTGFLWETFRMSWVIVTAGIGISVYLGLRLRRPFAFSHLFAHRARTMTFVIGIPIVILGLLFIPRAAGRIDPGSLSRLGIASIWFATILLPLYAFLQLRSRRLRQTIVVLACAALAGAYAPLFSYSWTMNPFDRIPATAKAADIVHGDDSGLPRLGPFLGNPDWMKQRAALKAFLDETIAETDTFLDMTNRSALYYLFDRRPPIEVAVYNLTNAKQERRAIASLQKQPPGLVLAGPGAILHDNAPVGLRSPLLFRYVIENYRPLEGGGGIWLKPALAQDRDAPRRRDEIDLLTRGFAVQNLGALPHAWGKAWNQLKPQLVATSSADFAKAVLHDAVLSADGTISATGPDPYATLDVSNLGIVGSESGIVSFDFQCVTPTAPSPLELFWTTEQAPSVGPARSVSFQANDGRIIVPVDAFPAWTLGGKISSLRIDLANRAACGSWRISDLTFAQRADLVEARKMWRP